MEQLVARQPHKLKVEGSIPSPASNILHARKMNGLQIVCTVGFQADVDAYTELK